MCAMAERSQDRKQLIFTAFDPGQGRGRELTRFETSPTPDAEYSWDLSPDGMDIAILRRSEAMIHILSLSRRTSEEVAAKGWNPWIGPRMEQGYLCPVFGRAVRPYCAWT
jgi:hypothetical protein